PRPVRRSRRRRARGGRGRTGGREARARRGARVARRRRGAAALGARRCPGPHPSLMTAPLRIVVASHDFKFFEQIRAHLASQPGVEIEDDRWTGTRPGDHDEAVSRRLLGWADVVVCEWCQANAVWYSHNKRPGQRLIVRLHRFEVENDLPALVSINAVDMTV